MAPPPGTPSAQQGSRGGWTATRRDVHRLLSTGVVHVLVVLAGTRAMSIIQQIVLVRLVSQDDMGGIIYSMRIVQLLALVAGLGMTTAVLKFCSEPIDAAPIRRRYRTALACTVPAGVAVAAVFAAVVLATNGLGGGAGLVGPMLLLAVYLSVYAIRGLGAAYLQARKQIKKASKITFLVQVGVLIVTVGTVLAVGVWGYYVGITVGAVVGAGLFLHVTRGAIVGQKADWTQAGRMINMGFFSILANFTGIANATVSVMLVKWLSGSMSEVAVFGIASYVVILVRMLPQSLRLTALPYLSGLLLDRQRLQARIGELIRKQLPVMLAIVAAIGAGGYWLMPLVLGRAYRACYLPTMIMLTSTLTWATVFPYGLLMVICNRVRLNFLIGVLQLAASVIMAILLIPRFGALGAAVAMAISMAVVVLPKWYFARQTLARIPLASQAAGDAGSGIDPEGGTPPSGTDR